MLHIVYFHLQIPDISAWFCTLKTMVSLSSLTGLYRIIQQLPLLKKKKTETKTSGADSRSTVGVTPTVGATCFGFRVSDIFQ